MICKTNGDDLLHCTFNWHGANVFTPTCNSVLPHTCQDRLTSIIHVCLCRTDFLVYLIIISAVHATPGRLPQQIAPCLSTLSNSHPLTAPNSPRRNSVLSGFTFSLFVNIHDWTKAKHDLNHSVLPQSPLMQRKHTAGHLQHRDGEG